MSNYKVIRDDEEFSTVLASAGAKLIVVNFYTTWSFECGRIAPVLIQLAQRFPWALFLDVDIDVCDRTANQEGVSTIPTFVLYKSRIRVGTIRGAYPQELEEKVRSHHGAETMEPSAATGQSADILQYIEQKECECFDEDAPDTPFQDFLEGKRNLESFWNPQLILVFGFKQNMKIKSFKMKSLVDNGPKTMKFFINQPKTLDFDSAVSMTPEEEIILLQSHLTGQEPIPFKFVKFHSVRNLQIFVADNQNGSHVTQIDALKFYGMPVNNIGNVTGGTLLYEMKIVGRLCRHPYDVCPIACQKFEDVKTQRGLNDSNALMFAETKISAFNPDLILANIFEEPFYYNTVGLEVQIKIEKRDGRLGLYANWSPLDKKYLTLPLRDLIVAYEVITTDIVWMKGKLLPINEDRNDRTFANVMMLVNKAESEKEKKTENENVVAIPIPRIRESFRLRCVNDTRKIDFLEDKVHTFEKPNPTVEDVMAAVQFIFYRKPLVYYSHRVQVETDICPEVVQNDENKRRLMRDAFPERAGSPEARIALVYYCDDCGPGCHNCKAFFRK